MAWEFIDVTPTLSHKGIKSLRFRDRIKGWTQDPLEVTPRVGSKSPDTPHGSDRPCRPRLLNRGIIWVTVSVPLGARSGRRAKDPEHLSDTELLRFPAAAMAGNNGGMLDSAMQNNIPPSLVTLRRIQHHQLLFETYTVAAQIGVILGANHGWSHGRTRGRTESCSLTPWAPQSRAASFPPSWLTREVWASHGWDRPHMLVKFEGRCSSRSRQMVVVNGRTRYTCGGWAIVSWCMNIVCVCASSCV